MTAGETNQPRAGQPRAGVVGAGVFGGYHAGKYAATEGVRLTAVFDSDADCAEKLANTHGAKPYTDYSSFLNAIDVLSVTTPAVTHIDVAQTALAAGKHCLVEKPLCLTISDAQKLISTAKNADVILQVGHQERFVAETEGLFADAKAIRRAQWRRCGPASGRCEDVSVVYDLMIHDLDLARQLHFGEPLRVEASGDDDEVQATLWFDQGRRLDFIASRRASTQNRTMTIDYNERTRQYDFATSSSTMTDPLGFGVQKFITAVHGHHPVAISGEDGLRALQWACLIEETRLKSAECEEIRTEAVA